MVQLTAPEGAKSFTIQRSAGTGTRISEVCFQIESNEPTENIQPVVSKTAVVKIIREGRVLILRDNKAYDIFGRRVE
jgi:predicted RecB family nuclease